MKMRNNSPTIQRQHSAIGRRKVILASVTMAAVVAAFLLDPPPLCGAYEMALGNVNASGDAADVPITGSGFGPASSLQFTVHWTPGTMTYSSATVNNTDFNTGTGVIFTLTTDANTDSVLTVGWTDTSLSNPKAPNGAPLFTLHFSNVTSSSTLTFTDDPTSRHVYDASAVDFSPITWTPGAVVVPEPINITLGLFACVFAGWKGLRWWFANRALRQPGFRN